MKIVKINKSKYTSPKPHHKVDKCYSWNMENKIEFLQGKYRLNEYGEDGLDGRIDGFIGEVNNLINDYSGDRTDRIYRYFIKSIQELVNEKRVK